MKTKNCKLSDILDVLRNGKGAMQAHFVYFEDTFIRDQLLLKVGREFDLFHFDELDELKQAKRSLFKPTIGIIKNTPETIKWLATRKPPITVLIELTDDPAEAELPGICMSLKSVAEANVVEAVVAWAIKRGFIVDPGAVTYGMANLTMAELKATLEFLALRDDNFVSLPAIKNELEEYEGNIFTVFDSLLSGNRWGWEKELGILLKTNAVRKILGSLTTQMTNILFCMQGKKGNVDYRTVAAASERKEGSMRMAMEKVKSMHFNDVRAVLLYNALAGLHLQLRRTVQPLNEEDTFRMALLKYFVDCGHAGN